MSVTINHNMGLVLGDQGLSLMAHWIAKPTKTKQYSVMGGCIPKRQVPCGNETSAQQERQTSDVWLLLQGSQVARANTYNNQPHICLT